MKSKLFAVVSFLFLLIVSNKTFACSCTFAGPFLEVAPNSALIVIGRVESINGHIAEITIQETIKGKASGKIKMYGDRGDTCLESLRSLKVGQVYAFALASNKGTHSLPGCGRHYVEINGDVVSGMINRDFMKATANGWPAYNGNTMPLSEFKPMLAASKGYDYPCKQPSKFAETEESKQAFAKAEAATTFDEWAFGFAVRKNDLKLTEYMLEKFEVKLKPKEFLKGGFDAASSGSIEMLQLFVSRGLPLNETDQYSGSLLSVSSTYPDMVEHLLKLGVKTDLKNMWGGTALMSAVSGGCPMTVKLLVAAGADVNATNTEGESVMQKAKKSDYDTKAEIVEMIKKK